MEILSAKKARSLMPAIPTRFIEGFNEKVEEAARKNETQVLIRMVGISRPQRDSFISELLKKEYSFSIVNDSALIYKISWRDLYES